MTDAQSATNKRSSAGLRIAFVTTQSDSMGGSHVHVRDVSSSLRQRGHDAKVFVGGNGPYYEQLDRVGVPYHKLTHMVRPIRPKDDYLAIGELAKALKEFNPDIISAHSSKAGIVARLAGRRIKVPTLFTAHGWSFADGVPLSSRMIYENAERALGMISAKVITVAEEDRLLAIKKKVVNASRLITIHNGMPDSPERADAGKQPPTVLSVARLDHQKDHPTLFQALAKLKDLPWRLELVGGGERREEFEKMVADLGISDRVLFHGVQSNVRPILANAQIFVLASNWEGFPRSTLEAMRTGLPAIVSDVGGAREAIEEGVSGYSVPARDVDALADRLRTLITQPELRVSMGIRARQMYEESFTFEAMMEKTLAVYRELLGNPSARL